MPAVSVLRGLGLWLLSFTGALISKIPKLVRLGFCILAAIVSHEQGSIRLHGQKDVPHHEGVSSELWTRAKRGVGQPEDQQ